MKAFFENLLAFHWTYFLFCLHGWNFIQLKNKLTIARLLLKLERDPTFELTELTFAAPNFGWLIH